MSTFSNKERIIARLLSATPRLKKVVKYAYTVVCALAYRKKYNLKIESPLVQRLDLPFSQTGKESFGGYYDHATARGKKVLSHLSAFPTHKSAPHGATADIGVCDLSTGKVTTLANTKAFNWQQGSRAMWINDEEIIYNDYNADTNDYNATVVSTASGKAVKHFDHPVQDTYKDIYFLSVNCKRISSLHKEYGYSAHQTMDAAAIDQLDNDGIWKTDIRTGTSNLIVTLQDITSIEPLDNFKNSRHMANHVMISPDGERFIFIHRYFEGKRRHDRLLLYSENRLSVLAAEDMVSHFHWLDATHFIGYLRHGNKNGYFTCDVTTGDFSEVEALNALHLGDGHPSVHGDWVVTDSYPDKSRLQHLVLLNMKTQAVHPLLLVKSPLKYMNANRCDLHPRFSDDGKAITFDCTYTGKRQQAVLYIGNLNDREA